MHKTLSLVQRVEVAWQAMAFFSVQRVDESLAALGKPPRPEGATITPMSMHDFMAYLKLMPEWLDIWEYAVEVNNLVAALEKNRLLTEAGRAAGNPFFGNCYYQLHGLPIGQAEGALWLAPVLGPQLIVHAVWTSMVHLIGKTTHGDEHGGTGLAVSDRHIITAKHVVENMALNDNQRLTNMQGVSEAQPARWASVVDVQIHPHHDLAVVTTDPGVQPLPGVKGLSLREPTWADSVLLLGYPIVPRAMETPLTVQLGEVATPHVLSYPEKHELFLYSAIARPGNSGGPIISTDGRLLGLVTEELYEQPADDSSRSPASPFYAGLPASVIKSGLVELGYGDLLVLVD